MIWVYLVRYFDKFLLFVISNGLTLYMICSTCNMDCKYKLQIYPYSTQLMLVNKSSKTDILWPVYVTENKHPHWYIRSKEHHTVNLWTSVNVDHVVLQAVALVSMLLFVILIVQKSYIVNFQVERSIHIVHQIDTEESYLRGFDWSLFILHYSLVTQVKLTEWNL